MYRWRLCCYIKVGSVSNQGQLAIVVTSLKTMNCQQEPIEPVDGEGKCQPVLVTWKFNFNSIPLIYIGPLTIYIVSCFADPIAWTPPPRDTQWDNSGKEKDSLLTPKEETSSRTQLQKVWPIWAGKVRQLDRVRQKWQLEDTNGRHSKRQRRWRRGKVDIQRMCRTSALWAASFSSTH